MIITGSERDFTMALGMGERLKAQFTGGNDTGTRKAMSAQSHVVDAAVERNDSGCVTANLRSNVDVRQQILVGEFAQQVARKRAVHSPKDEVGVA
jgi:hypothetical protein